MLLKERQEIYEDFKKLTLSDFDKKKVLGKGFQGTVYKYCHDQTDCIAVKKIYVDSDSSKFIKKPETKKALEDSIFIELFSNKLVNKLLLNGNCPNFIFHYNNEFEERNGICHEDYPNVSYFFNEYIDAITFTEWVSMKRTIPLLYNAFFQIVIGLYSAQKHFDLLHLDLHSDNILVKTINKTGYFKYIIDNIEYNIPNLGFVFLINDYGFAWIPEKEHRTEDLEFDLNYIFKDVEKYCSLTIKKDIKYMIKNLKSNKKSFPELINKIWGEYYSKEPSGKCLEIYDVDKKLKLDKKTSSIVKKGFNTSTE